MQIRVGITMIPSWNTVQRDIGGALGDTVLQILAGADVLTLYRSKYNTYTFEYDVFVTQV